MNDKDNFEFIGFPKAGEEIQIPDKSVKKQNNSKLNLNLEDLANNQDLIHLNINDLINELENSGLDLDSIFNSMFTPQTAKSSMMLVGDRNDDSNDKEYLLGSIDELTSPSNFAQILVVKEDNLYSEFLEKFGNGPYNFEKEFPVTMILNSADDVDVEDVEDLKVIFHTSKYVLLYGKSKNVGEVGVYIAAVKKPSGEFELILPSFGNLYDPESGKFISTKEFPNCFDANSNFILNDVDKVCAGLEFLLVEEKTPMINLQNAGTIKPIRGNTLPGDHRLLQIGNFTFSDSIEGRLLKRDAELKDDENTCPFYIKFSEEILDNETLNVLSEMFFRIDLSETELWEHTDVITGYKYVYINFDTDLPVIQNIKRWAREN